MIYVFGTDPYAPFHVNSGKVPSFKSQALWGNRSSEILPHLCSTPGQKQNILEEIVLYIYSFFSRCCWAYFPLRAGVGSIIPAVLRTMPTQVDTKSLLQQIRTMAHLTRRRAVLGCPPLLCVRVPEIKGSWGVLPGASTVKLLLLNLPVHRLPKTREQT